MDKENNEMIEGYKETEIGIPPEDWEVVKLEDVAHVKAGGPAPQGDHFFGGKNPFIRVQHIDEVMNKVSGWNLITDEAVNRYNLQLFPKGTIIFPKSCASIRLEKRAMLPFDAYIVSHLCAVLPAVQKVHNIFLFHTLRFVRFAESKSDGYPTLSLGEIKDRLIPLPPLPEQRKIAYVLSTIQKAIELQEKIIVALKELKKSLMRHLFTYGPVPVDQIDLIPLKETEIGMVPEHWKVTKLGEVAKTASGGTPSRKHPEYFGGKILWVKSGELNDNSISCTEETLTDTGLSNSNAKVFPEGTLLIAMYGATVGKVGILKCKAATNQAVCGVFPHRGIISKFLFYTIIYRRSELLSKRYGGAQPNISQTVIRAFNIYIPPLIEQHQIACILTTIDNKINTEEKRKSTLQSLFQTMLHLLMTGKVRVRDLEVKEDALRR
ncbi:MAG: restriction endonuclease subunit S [Clostridia bacterium]|nr:restriction endonuclease subunit S [Clostridia bacterium]